MRPVERNGIGLTTAETKDAFQNFIDSYFAIYDDEPGILAIWKKLVVDYDVKGKPAHDARLVAAMMHHKVDAILTFNAVDFARYSETRTIDPRNTSRI